MSRELQPGINTSPLFLPSRCKRRKFPQWFDIPSKLEEKFHDYTTKAADIQKVMESFQGTTCRSSKGNVVALLRGEGWSKALLVEQGIDFFPQDPMVRWQMSSIRLTSPSRCRCCRLARRGPRVFQVNEVEAASRCSPVLLAAATLQHGGVVVVFAAVPSPHGCIAYE